MRQKGFIKSVHMFVQHIMLRCDLIHGLQDLYPSEICYNVVQYSGYSRYIVSMSFQIKNPELLLYIVLPCILAVTYAVVVFDELKHAVTILALCVLFTTLLLSLLFIENADPAARAEVLKRNVYKVTHVISSSESLRELHMIDLLDVSGVRYRGHRGNLSSVDQPVEGA